MVSDCPSDGEVQLPEFDIRIEWETYFNEIMQMAIPWFYNYVLSSCQMLKNVVFYRW
jgi:hypothetical protein